MVSESHRETTAPQTPLHGGDRRPQLFVDPIDAKYHWGRAAIRVAFTLFTV